MRSRRHVDSLFVDRINPEDFLRFLDRLDVQIDHHGLLPGPDENAVSVHFSNAMTPESAAAAIVATLPAEALGDHRSSVFRMPRSIDDL